MNHGRLFLLTSVLIAACGGGSKPATGPVGASPKGTGAIYGGGGTCTDEKGDKDVPWVIGLEKVERCFYRADKKVLDIKLEGDGGAAIDVFGAAGPGTYTTGNKEEGETHVNFTGHKPGATGEHMGGDSAGSAPGYDCPAHKCTIEITNLDVASKKPGEKARAAVKVTCSGGLGFHAIGCGTCTLEPQPVVVDVPECEYSEN